MRSSAGLRREMIRQCIITGTVLMLCVCVYVSLHMYGNGLEEVKIQIDREITSINSRVVNFERKQQEYEEAKKLWSTLSDNQKKRPGIVLGNAQQFLENLKNQYALGAFKADISKPVELQDVYKTETTVVVSTRVDMVFDGLTDESIFAFISALNRGLPGYVKMDSLQVTRQGEVSPVLLKNLSEGRYQPVVQGRLSFYWRDLKDISIEMPAPSEAKGGPDNAG